MATIAEIIALVAREWGVDVRVLAGRMQTRHASTPRSVAMYLIRHHTTHSLLQVAGAFQRHHSTVMAAVCRVEARIAADPEWGARVRCVSDLIANGDLVPVPTAGADLSRQVYRLLDGIRERLDAAIVADPLAALVAVHKALGGAQ